MSAPTAASSADVPAGAAAGAPAPGRALLRQSGLALWTAVCFGAVAAGWTVAGVAPAAWRAHRRRVLRRWARGAAWLLGMRVEVSGIPPEPPFLLVANHLSYVDVILLGGHAPGLFVAKREVRGWPVWGLLAAAIDTIFVDRENRRDTVRVAEQIGAAIARGEGVVLFAEGTSTPGDGVLPLRPALLEAAAREGWPVRYASLSYRVPDGEPPAHLSVCWWGTMEFGPHFAALCGLPAFTGTLAFGPDAILERNRKVLAQKLHQAIERQFTPVVTREQT